MSDYISAPFSQLVEQAASDAFIAYKRAREGRYVSYGGHQFEDGGADDVGAGLVAIAASLDFGMGVLAQQLRAAIECHAAVVERHASAIETLAETIAEAVEEASDRRNAGQEGAGS